MNHAVSIAPGMTCSHCETTPIVVGGPNLEAAAIRPPIEEDGFDAA